MSPQNKSSVKFLIDYARKQFIMYKYDPKLRDIMLEVVPKVLDRAEALLPKKRGRRFI